MTSNASQAFVWIWLPQYIQPIVAGKISWIEGKYHFVYGRSYLEHPDAISLSPIELPRQRGTFEPEGLNEIHACLRDGAPDAWGRRVINYEYPNLNPNELDYLLLSGSNRIGALDFQKYSTHYQARNPSALPLQDLLQAAQLIEAKKNLPPELERALLHGTSVGGARPKVQVTENHTQYIAKFSSLTDHYDVVKAEYVAMKLAEIAGIEVAPVQLHQAKGKDILLVTRFDRIARQHGFERRLMLSGLSLLKLNEMEARYASYRQLAELIRHQFSNPITSLHELYQRIVFNILVGNTDDHARNHAAFWDGIVLSLTPAYDICPQHRIGQVATQAMNLEGKHGNHATLVNVLSICRDYRLEETKAKEIINTLISVINEHWLNVCDEAGLTKQARQRLWEQAVLNPYCFESWEY